MLASRLTTHNLLQPCIFVLGLLQDGDVRVSVFPESKEILKRGASFYGIALQYIGTGEAEMGQRADGFVQHNPAMVENFLELGCGWSALLRDQLHLPSHIDGIHVGRECGTASDTQFIGCSDLQRLCCLCGVVSCESQLCANRGQIIKIKLHNRIFRKMLFRPSTIPSALEESPANASARAAAY
jgi:hypothetical protein